MFGLLEYTFVSLSLALVIAVYFPVVHNQIVSRETRLEHYSLYWGTAVVSNVFTYGLLFAAGRAWSINFIMVNVLSRGELMVRMNLLGTCITRDGPDSNYLGVLYKGLARLSRRGLSRFLRGSREISSAPSRRSNYGVSWHTLLCLQFVTAYSFSLRNDC